MPIPPGIEMRSSPEQVLSVLGSVLRDGEGTEKFSNFLEIESVRKAITKSWEYETSAIWITLVPIEVFKYFSL